MKIAVLTSSRADYGIYKSLLSKLSENKNFELTIVAFGMHLQKQHGDTLREIEKDGFGIIHKVLGMPTEDMPIHISKGYGNLIVEFSNYWNEHKYDYVLALGDRFEMSAAVQAGIPFGVYFVHLHAGETTLGAIDNIYRHQITLASKMHFVSTNDFKKKVCDLTGDSTHVYNVGALSIDGVMDLELPNWNDVRDKFDIPDRPFILVTFHPETIQMNKNEIYSSIVFEALEELCQTNQIVITLANADTMGKYYRDVATKLKQKYSESVTLVNSFGKYNYFTAMKASKMLLGNTSSGILEAASFGKFVINVGKRQAGRLRSSNVFDIDFDKDEILNCVKKIEQNPEYKGENKYYKKHTANNIIKKLIHV